MINDYNAILGWKFDKLDSDNQDILSVVTTMVQIKV